MGNNVTTPSVGLKWGLILGLGLALMTTTFAFLNIFGPWFLSIGILLLLIVGSMAMGIKEFKEGNDTLATFAQGLSVAMIVVVVGGIISTSYSYIYNNYIDTQYLQNTIEYSLEKMQDFGVELDDEKYAEALEDGLRRGASIPSNLLNYLGFIIIGFIPALITAAIMQKKELDPSELARRMEDREE